MPTYVILGDRYTEQHADEIHGEANTLAIKKAALRLADDLGFDDGETLKVGIVHARDAGAARLKPTEHDGNGGITWLWWLRPGGEFETY